MDINLAMLRHLMAGGICGFFQQEFLIDRRENDGHAMGPVGVRTIHGNAVKILAEIDASLVANQVKMLARVFQQRAGFEGLLDNLRIADGIDIDMHDPLGVDADVFVPVVRPAQRWRIAPGQQRSKQVISCHTPHSG